MAHLISIIIPEDLKKMAQELARKRYLSFSALIRQLILAELKAEEELAPKVDQLVAVKPVGRPRHSGEHKQITRWIERAEKFPAYYKEELTGTNLFEAIYGEIQARLDKAIEERDGPTLEALAQGQEWQEARDAYWKKVEEEDRNVNS
jgi:predicted transcriptional regulator